MSTDQKHENGNGAAAHGDRCPSIRIVFNPASYQCVIDGSVPNLEFCKYMLQTALAQTEKQIAERDNPRIALATPAPQNPTMKW